CTSVLTEGLIGVWKSTALIDSGSGVGKLAAVAVIEGPIRLKLLLVVLPAPALARTMGVVLARAPLKITVNGPPGPPTTLTFVTPFGEVANAGIDRRWFCTASAVGETPGWNGMLTCKPPS